jgi:hypothetical protein
MRLFQNFSFWNSFLGFIEREPLETPVGFPEVPGRKSLIYCNIKNCCKAIFSMG